MQYNFGSGNMYALIGAVLVPRKLGTLQDVSIDISFSLKELYGQLQFPVAIARGQGKITGKAKAANFNANAMNDFFFGQTVTAGQALVVVGEAGSGAIPTTPFQLTVTNAATFTEDLGVTFAATGVALTRVASGPTTGQYSVAAGVYTFATADTGKTVIFDYSYTPIAPAVGKVITLNNQLVGTTPTFIGVFNSQLNGKQFQARFNACYSSKMTMASKIEDFTIPEFDFSASADAAGVIGTLGMSE